MHLPPHSRRGNYSILMGTSAFVLVGFSAIAVDISLITMAELQVQATADAASHAALVAYRNTLSGTPRVAAQNAADFMLKRNPVAMGTAKLDKIDYGLYDRKARAFCRAEDCSPGGSINAIQVDLSREGGNAVDLLLAPILGVNTHDVDANSITAQQQRAIMLVQDYSCSMSNGESPLAIDLSRTASFLFLDYLVAFDQAGDMLGMTGYAEWGATEIPMDGGGGGVDTSLGGGGGGVDDVVRFATTAVDPPFARLSFIATDESYLRQRFSAICSTTQGCPTDAATNTTPETVGPLAEDIGKCTNPGIAMRQAINELTTKTNDAYFRGMVVMSDGRFNCNGGAGAANDAADDAWNNHDVHIWTVLYHNGKFNVDQMEALIRGYGFLQFSPNPEDLPVMYATIAAALPTAIVD